MCKDVEQGLAFKPRDSVGCSSIRLSGSATLRADRPDDL